MTGFQCKSAHQHGRWVLTCMYQAAALYQVPAVPDCLCFAGCFKKAGADRVICFHPAP